jgi:pyruvate-ferredoxin/flavodoxin oxidoreductase
MLTKSKPEVAKQMLKQAQQDINARWKLYEYLAARKGDSEKNGDGGAK